MKTLFVVTLLVHVRRTVSEPSYMGNHIPCCKNNEAEVEAESLNPQAKPIVPKKLKIDSTTCVGHIRCYEHSVANKVTPVAFKGLQRACGKYVYYDDDGNLDRMLGQSVNYDDETGRIKRIGGLYVKYDADSGLITRIGVNNVHYDGSTGRINRIGDNANIYYEKPI